MKKLSFNTLFLILTFHAVWASKDVLPSDGIVDKAAYSIMFDSLVSAPMVDFLVRQCSGKNDGYTCKLPSFKNALGALSISLFPMPLETMQEIITSLHMDNIYQSTVRSYSCKMTEQQKFAFIAQPYGSVRFVASYKVRGKFLTMFAYTTQTQWQKSATWILERDRTLPGARQTRGIGGYINEMLSFTVLASLASNRTLRINATWNDIGGELPALGKVRAGYKDIADGMTNGTNDIRSYFKLRSQKP